MWPVREKIKYDDIYRAGLIIVFIKFSLPYSFIRRLTYETGQNSYTKTKAIDK
jgi:hypothetical protein